MSNEADTRLIEDISRELRTLTATIIAPPNDPCFTELVRLRALQSLQTTITRAIQTAANDLQACELRHRQQPQPTPTPGPGQ